MNNQHNTQLVPFATLIPPATLRTPSKNLVNDIRTEGLVTPLLVVPTEEGFVVVDGGRRWCALMLLGCGLSELVEVELLAAEIFSSGAA